jgi:RimJ/RimL family protein N-acetyltransferase
MPAMTDPSEALLSFQEALLQGQIHPQRGELDREIFGYHDQPAGTPRFTYARLDRRTVTALVILVSADKIEGIPCFQIGYAVPAPYRSQGRAKDAVCAAIAELWNGLSRSGMPALYIEAIVSSDNEASKRVASATLSAAPVQVTDSFSGLPALQYIRKFDAMPETQLREFHP